MSVKALEESDRILLARTIRELLAQVDHLLIAAGRSAGDTSFAEAVDALTPLHERYVDRLVALADQLGPPLGSA